MGKHVRSLFLFLCLAGLPMFFGESNAFAQYYRPSYGPSPGYYAPAYGNNAHDGLYMRLDIGVGYLSASETYGGGTDKYSGVGLTYGAAFGGAIAPNLILFGELFGTTVVNTTYTYRGVSQPSGMDLTLLGFGPGLAFFLEPINLYLSGSVALSKVYFSNTADGAPLGETNLGIGANFMVGEEWWISPNWGFGIAGQLHFASMGDTVQGYDTRMNALAFSVLFSATFN